MVLLRIRVPYIVLADSGCEKNEALVDRVDA